MAERYRKPQTIDELKRFCEEKGMPLEKMRFFIGEDYPHPRAFGIYEAEDGDFVVYKNKADGTRAIRYKGPNEAYAVNELYEKLKAETDMRRGRASTRNGGNTRSGGNGERPGGLGRMLVILAVYFAGLFVQGSAGLSRSTVFWLRCLLVGFAPLIIVLVITVIHIVAPSVYSFCKKHNISSRMVMAVIAFFAVLAICVSVFGTPRRGYYIYEDKPFYYYRGDWYRYDNSRGWYQTDYLKPDFEENYKDYYVSKSYNSDFGASEFEDSSWTGYHDSYYDSDDDYDWDSGSDWDSWDSSDTDWDSDW